MKQVIKVGTRESKLAVTQSKWVISEINKKFPYLEFELVGIKTSGDIILDKRLDKVGGKGLFIKELEQALIEKKIDMAVHSAKDMPAELPAELTIAAVSRREDPRDVLITAGSTKLDGLKPGAVVGTSSARREVQILGKREDVLIKTLRGNVLTRINKLLNNEYDAIILAMAGLKRLGLEGRCIQAFDVDDLIPAVGQGILAIETRRDDNTDYLMESIHCTESALCLSAERAFMIKLNGGCSTPIAAHATVDGDKMRIYGMLADEARTACVRSCLDGECRNAEVLGRQLADVLLGQLHRLKK